MNTKTKRLVAATALTVAAVGLSAGTVLASANEKEGGYEVGAGSSAGIDLTVVKIASADSSSQTNKEKDGASSDAAANALNVADVVVIGQAECGSSGTDNEGVDSASDSDALLDEEIESPVEEIGSLSLRVLGASCDSRAVQSNTAESSAESSVLDLQVGDALSVTVLGSSADNKTTSGQGRASSSFTVATVNDTNVLGCESQTQENRGGSTESDSAILLGADTGTACPVPVASSSVDFTKTTPAG